MIATAVKSEANERRAILTIFVMMFFQVTFFSLFEQAGSSMTLFTQRSIDRVVWGYDIPASWFQSLNPFFIIALGPVFTWLWMFLERRKISPYPPMKFALALIQVALGFLCLVAGITQAAHGSGLTSMGWMVLAYFFHTTGELCLSPVGLSMVSKLAPARLLSTIMGVWFLSISFANHLAGMFSKIAAIDTDKGAESVANANLYKYAFSTVTVFALVMAAILIMISPILRKVFIKNGHS